MGRCLDAKSTKEAILFDLVNNKNNLKMMYTKDNKKTLGPVSPYLNVSGQQLIIKDYTKDICEVLEEIQNNLCVSWTKEEDDIIKKYYPIEGSSCCARLPKTRTVGAVKARARVLNVLYNDETIWTKEEDDKLLELYECYGSKWSLIESKMKNRIRKEIMDLRKEKLLLSEPKTSDGDSHYYFDVLLLGAAGTPFENGKYRLSIELTSEYPFKPPVVKFKSKIYHPNVRDEKICLDIL